MTYPIHEDLYSKWSKINDFLNKHFISYSAVLSRVNERNYTLEIYYHTPEHCECVATVSDLPFHAIFEIINRKDFWK